MHLTLQFLIALFGKLEWQVMNFELLLCLLSDIKRHTDCALHGMIAQAQHALQGIITRSAHATICVSTSHTI